MKEGEKVVLCGRSFYRARCVRCNQLMLTANQAGIKYATCNDCVCLAGNKAEDEDRQLKAEKCRKVIKITGD